jgi:diadenosine tetraphosphate (Ap4A) HIT family hydrolase
MGEDRSRLSNPNALANLAFIRYLNLHVLARQSWDGWLPGSIQRLAANQAETLTMLKAC